MTNCLRILGSHGGSRVAVVILLLVLGYVIYAQECHFSLFFLITTAHMTRRL